MPKRKAQDEAKLTYDEAERLAREFGDLLADSASVREITKAHGPRFLALLDYLAEADNADRSGIAIEARNAALPFLEGVDALARGHVNDAIAAMRRGE